MNTFTETWKTFIPTKKQRRSQAIKDGFSFICLVVLHMALVTVVWISVIIVLSL